MPQKTSRKNQSYHHGQLREALLLAALELLEEGGVPKLSLRECARRAGVSHTAPYRHFSDKDALLEAVAEQGFDMLHAAALEAMEGIVDPQERFEEYGVAYVRFAFEHPHHHRVMFARPIKQMPSKVGAAAFELNLRTVEAVIGPDEDLMEAAIAAWSIPHGLSMLILDGRIPSSALAKTDSIEQLARRVYAFWRRRPRTLPVPRP